eukprot:12072688-Heterocapsa_arctica.AAC.1
MVAQKVRDASSNPLATNYSKKPGAGLACYISVDLPHPFQTMHERIPAAHRRLITKGLAVAVGGIKLVLVLHHPPVVAPLIQYYGTT